MKSVKAYLRCQKVEEAVEVLEQIGLYGMTVIDGVGIGTPVGLSPIVQVTVLPALSVYPVARLISQPEPAIDYSVRRYRALYQLQVYRLRRGVSG